MIKFRLYFDIEKEENFLNRMSAKGYAMSNFCSGFYSFMPSKENEYTYRIDLINDKTDKELRDYIDLVEESGAELVKKWGVWAIFRKKGEFKLYTDKMSLKEVYSKISKMFLLLGFSEFCFSLNPLFRLIDEFSISRLILLLFFVIVCISFLYQGFNYNNKINKLK